MDCFDEILDFYYHYYNGSKNSTELWTINYIIKLMNQFSLNHNSRKATNCLLFLINLFLIDSPDYSHNKGKKIKNLTKKEYKTYFKSLKSEFLS